MILTLVLTVLLVVVFLLNCLVLIVTYSNKTTKLCPFCRVFSLSYLGNIMGAFSLYLNDILQHGDTEEYKIEYRLLKVDHYFFLYMGIGLNMCGIVSFTYVRYKFLKANERPPAEETTREIFLKYMLPQILLTAVISALVTGFQHWYKTNLLNHSILITFLPISVIICVNVSLTRILQRHQKLGRFCNQEASIKKLRRAQVFILLTACLQFSYLMLGIITFLVYHYNQHSHDTMRVLFWIIRVLFFLVFTLEAKMFLYQIPEGRKTIKNALKVLFCIKVKQKPTIVAAISTINSLNNV